MEMGIVERRWSRQVERRWRSIRIDWLKDEKDGNEQEMMEDGDNEKVVGRVEEKEEDEEFTEIAANNF